MFKKIIKNTYLLGSGTLLSRVLGFVRDVLIAKFFGTTFTLEAFLVAFRISNLFRSVFAEGFFDSVATPYLAQVYKDKTRLFLVSNRLLSFSLVFLSFFILTAIFLSKYLIIFFAPGFLREAQKFNLTLLFLRLTFFYLFFIVIATNFTSLLYASRKFFLPAINPVFLNLSFIVGVFFFFSYFRHYILVICVLAAGVLQTIFPFFILKKEGFKFYFDLFGVFKDKEIIKMFKLFIPRLGSSMIYHFSVLIDTIFSSLTFLVGKGGLAAIYYANRLIQFPLAIIAFSISKVAIVDLSSYAYENKLNDFKKLFVFSFQNLLFFILPVTFLFLFLPHGLIEIIFKRGKFDLYSLKITTNVLFYYGWGLFFFCGIKLLVNSFYALKDTLTPTKTAFFSLLLNAILSGILIFPLKIGGVALGSSISAMFNFFLLYFLLLKKIGKIDWQDTKIQFIKIVFLSILIGIVSRIVWDLFILPKYFKILIILIVNLLILLGGGYFLKVKQTDYLKRWLIKT
ncbi:MAG TPA: murein biosynthesis integral membrane protein MurJ [Candidatus Omnitrophica bacterium]|nr:murein biosynthesis integral membrane protein MurJ [Candidatus Omnitrophota bacterium]